MKNNYRAETDWEKVNQFFGKTEKLSPKYFKFDRIIDEDNIIILSENVLKIKDNFVLVIGNSSAVYIKKWNITEVSSYKEKINSYAIKLSRKYYKPYNFKKNFEMEKPFYRDFTFDDFVNVAKKQQEENIAITLGHYKSIDKLHTAKPKSEIQSESKIRFEIINNVLINYNGNEENVIIPENVEAIGKCAFEGCSNIKSIKLNNNISYIGEKAFSNCKNLKEITFPDKVHTIRKFAFSGCENLRKAILPKNLERIEESVFENCKNLQEINIPDNCTYISNEAFNDGKLEMLNHLLSTGDISIETYNRETKNVFE